MEEFKKKVFIVSMAIIALSIILPITKYFTGIALSKIDGETSIRLLELSNTLGSVF